MLKLGIHMDNELLYCGIEILTPCPYSSLHLSIFLSFKAKFVSQFSPEICKLESSGTVQAKIFKCGIHMYNEWFYRRIETQGHGSYFSIFQPFFFLSLYNILTDEICVRVFSGTYKARMLIVLWNGDSDSLLLFFPLFVHFSVF